ncbi:MAG: ABC-F family ATP-binding cassette domain-containing protein [Alphaproteobacteria bacterium]|nr:ABC-F family ATP-binding cassette domain-containing protein [Alphaproteobacteria bacterium]
MAFISLSNVYFGYSDNNLLDGVSIAFNDNDHVAIIGDNGCGKTTLLRLLTGEILPNSGNINRNASVFMLNQTNVSDSKSGGEQQMFALMRAFDSAPDILLLDEPTNNLDADAKRLFFNRMRTYPNGIVVVSHDRELLQHVDKIIELSNGQIRVYGGNYDFYQTQKQIEADSIYSKYVDTQKSIARLNDTINIAQNTRQHHESKQQKDLNNSKRSRMAANALKGKSQETEAKKRAIIQKKMDKQLLEQQTLAEQMRNDTIKIPMPNKPFYSKELVNISALTFSYGDKQIFNDFDFVMYGKSRIRLTGKNGSGKTTLIKIICGELQAQTGTIKTFGKIAYINQDLSVLNKNKTIVENIMETSGCLKHDAHAIAANFGFRGDASTQIVGTLSGGELLKATLAAILGNVNQPDLLILDEPTNNLEIKSISILEDALNQYTGAILLVSHDEMFVKNIKIDKEIHIGEQ